MLRALVNLVMLVLSKTLLPMIIVFLFTVSIFYSMSINLDALLIIGDVKSMRNNIISSLSTHCVRGSTQNFTSNLKE